MSQHTSATTIDAPGAVSLYDRFAQLYDITFKFNGYARSLERYLRERALTLGEDADILDAGCGTGLVTLAILRTMRRPSRITSIDLSAPSLAKARYWVAKETAPARHRVRFAQANLLALPFADETFDFIATSGALEYVPLGAGLSELARVLKPGGHLLHLPIRPTPASLLLEALFRFKAHPPAEIERHTSRHFRILERHHFPPLEPIGWTKLAILAQKP